MNERFLLDTNIPSETVNRLPDMKVSAWLKRQVKDTLFLSAVTMGELRKGIELLAQSARRRQLEEAIELLVPFWFAGRILPVTREVAERWGVFEARRQNMGLPLSVPDGMIAATAFEHGLTLVTRNVKDFVGLGITVLNPWET